MLPNHRCYLKQCYLPSTVDASTQPDFLVRCIPQNIVREAIRQTSQPPKAVITIYDSEVESRHFFHPLHEAKSLRNILLTSKAVDMTSVGNPLSYQQPLSIALAPADKPTVVAMLPRQMWQ